MIYYHLCLNHLYRRFKLNNCETSFRGQAKWQYLHTGGTHSSGEDGERTVVCVKPSPPFSVFPKRYLVEGNTNSVKLIFIKERQFMKRVWRSSQAFWDPGLGTNWHPGCLATSTNSFSCNSNLYGCQEQNSFCRRCKQKILRSMCAQRIALCHPLSCLAVPLPVTSEFLTLWRSLSVTGLTQSDPAANACCSHCPTLLTVI